MFAVLAFVGFMQVNPTTVLTGDPIVSTAPAAHSSTQTVQTTTVVFRPATEAEITADSEVATRAGMRTALTDPATDAISLARGGLGMGDWMLTRDPNRILDYPPVHTLSTDLRWAGVIVWIVALGLVIAKHVLGPFVGAEPAALYLALPVTATMGTMGFFNEPILRAIMNAVHALLGIIANASLRAALEPGLRIGATPAQVIEAAAQVTAGTLAAPFVALLVAIVSLLIILKMWAQVGWLFILSAPAPIYMSATGAPLLGRYAAQWWRAWFGTLLDPILLIAGLRIAAAGLGFLDGHFPYLWDQLMTLAILIPLLAAPGFHAGAYGGSGVDWLLGMALYRATNALRHRPTGGSASPPHGIAPNAAALSGKGYGGTGGGNAAAWWKTGRWTPQTQQSNPIGNRLVRRQVGV